MGIVKKISNKAIKHIVTDAIPTSLRSAISSYEFKKAEFGGELKESTIDAKRRKKSTKPSMPLYDTGDLSMGIKGKMKGKARDEGEVITNGKSKEIQGYLFEGTKNMVARPLFNVLLPAGDGLTIENSAVGYYAAKVGTAVNNEIIKLTKKVNKANK